MLKIIAILCHNFLVRQVSSLEATAANATNRVLRAGGRGARHSYVYSYNTKNTRVLSDSITWWMLSHVEKRKGRRKLLTPAARVPRVTAPSKSSVTVHSGTQLAPSQLGHSLHTATNHPPATQTSVSPHWLPAFSAVPRLHGWSEAHWCICSKFYRFSGSDIELADTTPGKIVQHCSGCGSVLCV